MSTKSKNSSRSNSIKEENDKKPSDTSTLVDTLDTRPRPRLCHLKKWPGFQGYGFNLHAEKSRMGQHIGKVDADSPAESAGLKEGDRIIEVNNVNISNENHQQVVKRIRKGLERDDQLFEDEVLLLVLDKQADDYYKKLGVIVKSDFDNVLCLSTQAKTPLMENKTQQNNHTLESSDNVDKNNNKNVNSSTENSPLNDRSNKENESTLIEKTKSNILKNNEKLNSGSASSIEKISSHNEEILHNLKSDSSADLNFTNSNETSNSSPVIKKINTTINSTTHLSDSSESNSNSSKTNTPVIQTKLSKNDSHLNQKPSIQSSSNLSKSSNDSTSSNNNNNEQNRNMIDPFQITVESYNNNNNYSNINHNNYYNSNESHYSTANSGTDFKEKAVKTMHDWFDAANKKLRSSALSLNTVNSKMNANKNNNSVFCDKNDRVASLFGKLSERLVPSKKTPPPRPPPPPFTPKKNDNNNNNSFNKEDLDSYLEMSAAEFKNYLKSKGRADPRIAPVDMKQKFQIFQDM